MSRPGPSRGGVGGVGGSRPAKVFRNEKFDCSLGPSAIKYPWAHTGSPWPWSRPVYPLHIDPHPLSDPLAIQRGNLQIGQDFWATYH